MSDNLSPAALTRLAISEAESGGLSDARRILAETVDRYPDYALGWLWFAYVAESDADRKYCLERAADLEPTEETLAALAALDKVDAAIPTEVLEFGDPAPPPDLIGGIGSLSGKPRRPWWHFAAPLLIAVIGAGLFAWFINREEQPESPLYIAVVAGGIDTPGSAGREIPRGVQLSLDAVNADGGIDGHPVEILLFDDNDDPEQAKEVAQRIVDDPRILLVIGHRTSTTSVAAGPIYAAAGMPVISSTATADAVTDGNPWYFRTIYSNNQQGAVLATYLRLILGYDRISIISGNADYGVSLRKGLISALETEGTTIIQDQVIDVGADDAETLVTLAAGAIANDPDPGVVTVALPTALAQSAIVALRDAGYVGLIVGTDSVATGTILSDLIALGTAVGQPDQYIANLNFTVPLLYDSLNSAGLSALDAYRERYTDLPSWRVATSYDAASVAAYAMGIAFAQDDLSLEQRRTAIRDGLASLDARESAIQGLTSPIYFDENGTMPRSVTLATVVDGRAVSGPIQLQPWTESSGLPVDETIEVNGQRLAEQRVVYTGMIFNEVRDFDPVSGTFFADLFVWINYAESEEVSDIILANAEKAGQGLGVPLVTQQDGDLTYRLYRVATTFTGGFDFHDFPFDSQELIVTLAHRKLPSSRVIFVIDNERQRLSQEDLLSSGLNKGESINQIDNWQPDEVTMFRETVGTSSTLGLPSAGASSESVEFSRMSSAILISRRLESFLVKNLLPLVLLAAVTYISLFIPHSQTGTRVSFGITGILTGVVLLSGVTDLLPDVDYTVAIEWAFYIFILLSAITILVGLLGDRYFEARNFSSLKRLDWISRTAYPLIMLATVAWYWTNFF